MNGGRPLLSASIMCADPLQMDADLRFLEKSDVAYFHCDVMDGHFVPNLMLSTETVRAVKARYRKPLDIHLMVEQPERLLEWFPLSEGDVVSVHYESTRHIARALSMISERGATPALALNPATPLHCALGLLPEIGMLLLMTVNPGFAAQRMVPFALKKIAQARAELDALGYASLPIEADGNCSLENIPKMKAAGASVFVAGSSSLFAREGGVRQGLARTLAALGS